MTRFNQGFHGPPPLWAWIIAAVLWLLVAASAAAGEISGHVDRVVDADTLIVNGTRIRLCGVDSPERATDAGKRATAWAKGEWLNAPVTCLQTSTDRYGRAVAVCRMFREGIGVIDIGWQAWRAGHAVQWARYWRGCGYHAALEPDTRRD